MNCTASPAERESLYAEIQPLVRRLIRQYGQDQEMQQDLRGEIFWRFCTLLDEYEPERGIPLRPYLVRKLVTSVYTYARRQWLRQRRETVLGAEVQITASVEPVDPVQEWDQRLLDQEVLARLPQAITTLSARQRYVVVSRFYEGRSFEEIAEVLSVRPATARSLLRHAMTGLRRYFSDTGLTREA